MKNIVKTVMLGTIFCSVITNVNAQVNAGDGTWTDKAPLSIGRAEIGVAALKGKIYVVGGTQGVGDNPITWASTLTTVYDPAKNTWQEAAPLPKGMTHAGVTVLDGKLYAVGSFTKAVHIEPLNIALVYDPKTNQWSALPPISSNRGSVAAVGINGKLHIFGGRISNTIKVIPMPPGAPPMSQGYGTVNTHQIYNPATGKWSESSPVPGPARDHMGIVELNGKIHLFGGRIADVVDNLDRHDVYDPKTNKWTVAAPLPRPRSSGAYTVLNGLILYAGGECQQDGNIFDDVTAYDAKQDKWITLKGLPKARHAFGAATVGKVAYFVAGAPHCGGGATTDLQSLTLP